MVIPGTAIAAARCKVAHGAFAEPSLLSFPAGATKRTFAPAISGCGAPGPGLSD
jgi:hypothetical protein